MIQQIQPYKYFWGQEVTPIIQGGKVSSEDIHHDQYIRKSEQPQMKASSRMQMMDNTFSSLDSNQLEESLKSILMKAGIKQKEMNDPQYAPVIKALIIESQKSLPYSHKFKSTVKITNTLSNQPKKSIYIQQNQLNSIIQQNNLPPPPPPPPPIATLAPTVQKKQEAFGGDLLDQIKAVQLKKAAPTSTIAQNTKQENTLTAILAQAMEERRQQLKKNYVSSSSSCSDDSYDY